MQDRNRDRGRVLLEIFFFLFFVYHHRLQTIDGGVYFRLISPKREVKKLKQHKKLHLNNFSPFKTARKLWLFQCSLFLAHFSQDTTTVCCTSIVDRLVSICCLAQSSLVTVPLFIFLFLWQVSNNLRHRISHFSRRLCALVSFRLRVRFNVCAQKFIFCILPGSRETLHTACWATNASYEISETQSFMTLSCDSF